MFTTLALIAIAVGLAAAAGLNVRAIAAQLARRRCVRVPVIDLDGQSVEIPVLEARILELHPGDIVVLRCTRPLGNEALLQIKESAAQAFGFDDDQRVVVLDHGLDLDIVRAAGL